ncbi:MAG: hypothetical protein U0132_08945 [Gemmatimonadaceae bacterium]
MQRIIRNLTLSVVGGAVFVLSSVAALAQRSARPVSAERIAPRVRPAEVHLTGFMLGVHTIAAPGVSITPVDADESLKTNFGSGLGVMVGYGINSRLTVFSSLDLAKQGSNADDGAGTFGLVHFEVGARANFSSGTSRTVPYVSGSVGRRAVGARVTAEELGDSFDLSFSGPMFAFGGGLQHYFRPNLAWDGGVEFAMGKMGHVTAGTESHDIPMNGTSSLRMHAGVTWHP